MRAIQRRCTRACRSMASSLCTPAAGLPLVARPAAAAAAGAPCASVPSVRAWGSHASFSTASNSSSRAKPASDSVLSASATDADLLPSQMHIVLPQLSPRMERGSVARWLVREGEEIKPLQVFMHVQTNELTEDGSPYVLEIESHDSGVLRRILVAEGSGPLAVGSPLAVLEDPEWSEGDKARGEFLWQAYVMQGTLRSGSCAPTRQDEPSDANEDAAPADPAAAEKSTKTKATKTTKPRAPRKKKTE